MKRILLIFSLLLIAFNGYTQGTLPIGGKTVTTENKGAFLQDSTECLPWGDTGRISHFPGMDTVNRQFIVNRSDTSIYFLYKKKWIKLLSLKDSGSFLNIYNSDGTLLANRTVTGAAKDLTITGVHDFQALATHQANIQGTSSINLSTSGVIYYYGGKVNPAVQTYLKGSTQTLTAGSGIYDLEFAGGSGVSHVNLPTGTLSPIGAEYIISDYKATAANNETIIIDAGIGNVIISSQPIGTQTYTMKTNGQVVRLKKVTNTDWKIEGGTSTSLDTSAYVDGGRVNSLLTTNSTGHMITPSALTWNDLTKFFEIRNAFRYDSVLRLWSWGDIDVIANSTIMQLNDAAKTIGANASAGVTFTSNTGEFVVVAQNLRNSGGVINSAITSYAYGSTHTLAFAGAVLYDFQYSTGSGASTLNLPLSPPLGVTYIISDLGAACSSNNITLDSGLGNVIVGSTAARTYVMSTDGQSVIIKYVASGKWKIE